MMQVPERRPRGVPVDAFLPSTSAASSPTVAEPRQVPASRPDALLAMADGSLWFGRHAERATAVAGPVRLDGPAVIIGDRVAMVLQDGDVASLGQRLEQARGAGRSTRGCVTAAGATLPIHEAVARAIAAGQIGTP